MYDTMNYDVFDFRFMYDDVCMIIYIVRMYSIML